MNHDTPLKEHIKHSHFWWDTCLVVLLWVIWIFWPFEESLSHLNEAHTAIKVISLVALLEWVAFLSFHLFSKGQGVIIQGLLGGMISSTTVFVKLTRSRTDGGTGQVSVALLSATLAMLVECALIVLNFASEKHLEYLLPIVFQIFYLSILILYSTFALRSEKKTLVAEYKISDDPIIWKKVLKLSGLVLLLIWGMKLVHLYAPFNPSITVFIMSLFEAHSVLTAAMIAETNQKIILLNILLILSGHTASKCYFIFASNNKNVSRKIAWHLLACLALTWIFYLFL